MSTKTNRWRWSQWHFDTRRTPEQNLKDSYIQVCKFNSDWTQEIQDCQPNSMPWGWADSENLDISNSYQYEGFILTKQMTRDLKNVAADKSVDRAIADSVPKFINMSKILGLKDCTIRYHNQRPGQMLHTHVDYLYGPEATRIEKNPDLVRRFAIMLSDWELGQVFMLGNSCWTQWSAGDCITWNWRDIPHSTANTGFADRHMVQITGLATDETDLILQTASPDKVFTLL